MKNSQMVWISIILLIFFSIGMYFGMTTISSATDNGLNAAKEALEKGVFEEDNGNVDDEGQIQIYDDSNMNTLLECYTNQEIVSGGIIGLVSGGGILLSLYLLFKHLIKYINITVKDEKNNEEKGNEEKSG